MVKNPRGEEVESKLYQDLNNLMSYVGKGGRQNVLPLYQKTLDPKFVQDMEDKGASFDENGEVSLYDFWNFTDAGKTIPESVVLQYLNESNSFFTKNEQTTYTDKQEVLDKVVKFNDSPWGKRFVAIFQKIGSKFGARINTLNDANKDVASRTKYYSNLSKRLASILENWGVAIEDVNELEERVTNGYINFDNAAAEADGLVHLIYLLRGRKGEKSLPEEFAHFAIRSMKDSPLITRAINQLKKDQSYREILGDELDTYTRIYKGDENLLAEEALGKVLAAQLQTGYEPETLMGRIINSLKQKFGRRDEKQIIQAALDADIDLGTLSQDLLEGKYEHLQTSNLGTGKMYQVKIKHEKTKSRWDVFYENTLRRQTIYQKRRKEMGLTAEDASEREGILEEQGALLQQLDTAAHREDWSQSEKTKEEFRVDAAINLISLAIKDTERIRHTVAALREQIDNGTYKGSLNSACAKVRAIMDYLESYEQIYSNFDSLLEESFNDPALNSFPEIEQIRKDLREQATILHENLKEIKREVLPSKEDKDVATKKQPLAMTVFLRGLSQFIPEGAAMSFGTGMEGEMVTLEELLMYSDNDITAASMWLNSMANTGDTIARIYDHIVKKQKGEARQECLEVQRIIMAAGKKLEKFGFSAREHEWMYQKTEDGVNFAVDEQGRPMYIKDYDEDAAVKDYKAFKQGLYAKYKGLPYDEQQTRIEEETEAFIQERWTKRHGEYYPKPQYYPNAEYEKLSDAQKEFYQVFMEQKRKLDRYLPIQTKDSTTAIIVRKGSLQRLLTICKDPNLLQSIKDWFSDAFKRKATDDEFGTTSTLVDFQGREVQKVPIYYTRIDRNARMHDYSMNCVANLCLYAQTATNYKALAKVVETLELGRDVLAYRQTNKRRGGKPLVTKVRDGNKVLEEYLYLDQQETNFTKRLNNFMDMQVYGKMKTGKNAKPAGFFSRVVGLFTTAVNVFVAITNVLQGLGQINIEMFAGQHFTMGDMIKAKLYYWKHIVPAIFEAGSMTKQFKLSLLSEDFNVMQEFESNTRDLNRYEKNQVYRLADQGILYIMNHAGEHYMQHITFLAMANRDKVYDQNGKAISIFDAYEVQYIDPSNPSLGARLVLKTYDTPSGKSQVYKTKDGKTIVTMEQLKARQASMKRRGKDVDLYSKALLWNENEIAEYDFKNDVSRKSAKLNQDMHGIYNEEDKNMLQQKAWGGLFMMYRKHIMPNFMKRYKFDGYDYDLGTATYGYQRWMWENKFKIAKKLFTTELDEKGKKVWAITVWTPQERANLMRNVGQLFNWVSINLLISALDSDDDDDDLWRTLILVSLYRTKSENAQFEPLSLFSKYSFIQEWLRLADQPVVGMSIVDRFIGLTELLDPSEWNETISRGKYAGKTKAQKRLLQLIPGHNQLINTQHPPLDYYRKSVGEDWITDKMFE